MERETYDQLGNTIILKYQYQHMHCMYTCPSNNRQLVCLDQPVPFQPLPSSHRMRRLWTSVLVHVSTWIHW